jgi:hypothetical protein
MTDGGRSGAEDSGSLMTGGDVSTRKTEEAS